MSDLEMTRLCAEAMGYTRVVERDDSIWVDVVLRGIGVPDLPTNILYEPLVRDEQVMKLVKKCRLFIAAPSPWTGEEWKVENGQSPEVDEIGECSSKDLNRAIVECVAKMQAAKAIA